MGDWFVRFFIYYNQGHPLIYYNSFTISNLDVRLNRAKSIIGVHVSKRAYLVLQLNVPLHLYLIELLQYVEVSHSVGCIYRSAIKTRSKCMKTKTRTWAELTFLLVRKLVGLNSEYYVVRRSLSESHHQHRNMLYDVLAPIIHF